MKKTQNAVVAYYLPLVYFVLYIVIVLVYDFSYLGAWLQISNNHVFKCYTTQTWKSQEKHIRILHMVIVFFSKFKNKRHFMHCVFFILQQSITLKSHKLTEEEN